MELTWLLPSDFSDLTRPTSEEIAVVHKAIASIKFVEELNRQIGNYRVLNASGIFDLIRYLNSNLDDASGKAGIRQNPAALPLALRAAKFLPSFRKFLSKAFDSPRKIGPLNTAGDWDRLSPPERFVGAMFWEQLNWLLGLQLPLSADEFLEYILESRSKPFHELLPSEKELRSLKRRKKNLCVLATGPWVQLVEIKGDVPSFQRLFRNGPIDDNAIRKRANYIEYLSRETDILSGIHEATRSFERLERAYDELATDMLSGTQGASHGGVRLNLIRLEASIKFIPYTDYDKLDTFDEIELGAGRLIPLRDADNDISRKPLSERLAAIDKILNENPKRSTAEIICEIFPELLEIEDKKRAASLPAKAPAIWTKDKKSGDAPPDFIKRHYAPWLGGGLTRADIRRLDFPLYEALSNWLRNNKMPNDLDLPTLKERNDRWVERIKQGEDAPVVTNAKEAEALGQMIRRRTAKKTQGK